MKKILIDVRELTKVYPSEKKNGSPFVAVDRVSFQLHQGEILGLLGPNGAGKSTTIQMLMGTLTPTSGVLQYQGKDLSTHRSQIMESVTFASTYVKMPWRLTVMENLRIYSLLYGVDHQIFEKRAEKFLSFFGVWDQRFKSVGQLSAGQITRIMLAKAFIPYPKIVLLDEPTASLDPDMAHQVRKFIKQQQSEYRLSIIYTSHNMDEVSDVCDRVIFLQNGRIVAQDKPEMLAQSVSATRLRLIVKDGLKRIKSFAKNRSLKNQVEGREIVIEINEQLIAEFLNELANQGIQYSQISIDKPTLEDYFLSMSQRKN